MTVLTAKKTRAVVTGRGSYGLMRRSGDVIIACAMLALALPLLLITALAIRWEGPGPVLERRTRIGANGRRFEMLSFRATFQQSSQLGHFLRSTRIDALPQLFNVLRGEMTLLEMSLFD